MALAHSPQFEASPRPVGADATSMNSVDDKEIDELASPLAPSPLCLRCPSRIVGQWTRLPKPPLRSAPENGLKPKFGMGGFSRSGIR